MLLDNSISGKKLSKSREDISYQKADMGQELAMKKKKRITGNIVWEVLYPGNLRMAGYLKKGKSMALVAMHNFSVCNAIHAWIQHVQR